MNAPLWRIVVFLLTVAQKFLGDGLEHVGAWLAVIQMGWRDPFGVAVGAFAGGPAAGFDDGVMAAAAEGQVVEIGCAA